MTTTAIYTGPLQGLKVLDFGHYCAGPMAAMVLADQGANVIRIVKPGAPELPEQQYRLYNRNKKLLALDLKTEAGKSEAEALIATADVVIENFRPGVMRRLGLDYASVKAYNPGLIYLSLPGFASTDTTRAHLQAWEGIISAAAGIYAEANLIRSWLNYPPVYTPFPICSSYGAMQGAVAVMAALNAREQYGAGTCIETPLVDAGMSSLSDCFIARPVHSQTLRATFDEQSETPDWQKPYLYNENDKSKTQEQKLFDFGQKLIWGYAGFYKTADDRYVITIPFKGQAERYFKLLGLYTQLIEEGFIFEGPWWELNHLGINVTGGLDPKRMQHLRSLIADVLKTKTAQEWEDTMTKAGIGFSLIRTREEWLNLEPMLKSGVLTQMDNGHSVLTGPGRVADMSGPGESQVELTPREAEIIDSEQAQQIFNSAGSHKNVQDTQTANSPTLTKGDLLKDLKVLDLCNILAGPMSGYTLAQYGADVITAEPADPFNVPTQILDNLMCRQGKRSLIWDIKTEPGRELMQRLVRWADVVVHNILDDTAARMGVTQQQLKQINPNVVVCQISATGGSVRGYWENRPGIDPMGNMPTGQYIQFGSRELPQLYGGVSSDTMCGISLAFSSLLGLYQLRKTGYAGEGRTSLVRASNQNQFPWVIAENGNCHWGEARGQFAVGDHELHRMYLCKDGWLFVGTEKERALDLYKTITGDTNANEQSLEKAFKQQNRTYWQGKLDAAEIACHPVLRMDDICEAQQRHSVSNDAEEVAIEGPLQVLQYDDHPCGSPVIVPGASWARIGENPTYKRLTPAVRIGANSRDILRMLDYCETEINELIRLRVVHEFLPPLGSKEAYFFKGPSIIDPPRE